ncbi:uncharacterized protein V6R79_022487 [Siganus canaliculatus]
MVPPPAQRVWVGVLPVIVVLVAELPGVLQRPRPGWSRLNLVSDPRPGCKPATQDPGHEFYTTKRQREKREEPESGSPASSSRSTANQDPELDVEGKDINKYCKFLWKNSSTINYNKCARANRNYRSETCLDVTIPDDHLDGCRIYPEPDSPHSTVLRPAGAGIPDADFLLYLHVQDTDKCRSQPSVSAYAVHCQTDPWGRPLAGVVVLCRDRLSRASCSLQTTVQTVVHELLHSLGFSKHLFHAWRDCSSTSPVRPGCSPRGRVTHSDGSGQTRIYSPSVISALQKHLAASDPELGGPLENLDVPPGGVSSHWEARILQGSIMAAELEDSTLTRIDPVTLAALQDTGWYTVNLNQAQSLVWGNGQGAMFGSVSTCQREPSDFFCTGSGFGCHYLHLHKGECQTDQYLEGCRVHKPFKNGSECWKKENRPTGENWSGEVFGFDSRCFFSSLNTQKSNSSVEGRCYRHRCTGPNRYQIQVSGSEWVDCPAGGTIQIEGYQGSVSCPDQRLCVFSDVAPPAGFITASPSSVTSAPSADLPSAQSQAWVSLLSPAEVAVAAAFSISILSAALVSVHKYWTFRVRVHAAVPPVSGGGLE